MSQQHYQIECLVRKDPHDLLKASNKHQLNVADSKVSVIKYIGYDLRKDENKLYWSCINGWEQEIHSSILLCNVLSTTPINTCEENTNETTQKTDKKS